MKKQIIKVKNKIKEYTPEILAVAATATALAVIVIKTNDNSVKIKLGPEAMSAMEDGTLTRFTTEDDSYIYTITQK